MSLAIKLAIAIVLLLATIGGDFYWYFEGAKHQAAEDNVAALNLENERKQAVIEETTRQLNDINALQQRETDRAAALQVDLDKQKDAITNDTPANTAPAVDRAMSKRLSKFR